MALAKESGIYIAIGLDTTELVQDISKVRLAAGKAGEDISKAFGGTVSVVKLRRDIVDMTTDIAKASAAVKNFNVPVKIEGLDGVAKNAGLASARVNDLYGAMVKTANAKAYENALAHIQKQAGLTSVEMVKLRRETGDVSGALKQAMGALNTRSQSTIVADMKEVVATFKEVRRNADSTSTDVQRAATAMREGLKKLATEARGIKVAPTVNMSGIRQALAQVQASTKLSTQEIERLSASATRFAAKKDMDGAFARIKQEAGLSTVQMAKLRYELGDTSGAFKAAGMAALPVIGTLAAFGATAFYMGKACFDAGLQLDRLNKSYTSIAGSSQAATVQLDHIYSVTDRLGLQFQTTAEAAKGFFAAGQGTALEKDLNGIFEGVATAASALSLSQEQVNRTFVALGQMISKGKISSEEMRQQFGEHIPGALELTAKAMGLSTAQFEKMMERGELLAEDVLPKIGKALKEKYADGAIQAADGAQSAINKMSSEWELFKASAINTKTAVAGINAVTWALKGMRTAMEDAELDKRLREAGVKPKGVPKEAWQVGGDHRIIDRGDYADSQRYNMRVHNTDNGWEISEQQRTATILARQKAGEVAAAKEAEDLRKLTDNVNTYTKALKENQLAKAQADYEAVANPLKEMLTSGKGDAKELTAQLALVDKAHAETLKRINERGGATSGSSVLNAYTADIERTTASVTALQAQLDAPANDTAARDRIRIAKEYEQTVADIEKQAANYAAKNGIGEAQADELKKARLLEAQLKQNLGLRDVEAKNADIRLDFEKRYADMTGATSAGVIASIKKQAEEYEKAGADQVRVAEWTQDQIQRASREGFDGIQVALKDFQNEYSNDAKNFGQLYGDMFRGIDGGFNTMWEDMISTGKVSLSSFKSMFRSFLADLMHMAITRPITVSIAGVVSGVFGGAGRAAAAGASGVAGGNGGGGLLGNLPISQMLPNSWTSGVSGLFGGVTGAVNGWAAGAFPSVFASNPAAAALNGFAGVGPTGVLSGALSAGALGGGLGSLGYTMLGGAIGLPQSKYSGITSGLGGALGGFAGSALASSSMMAGSAMAAGATMGSVFPVVGTIIGALAGGLIGALSGRGDKRIPSTNLNNGTSAALMGTDYASLLGNEHWGTKMDGGETSQIWSSIGAIANETVTGFQTFASALPAQYAAEVNRALSTASVRFDYDAEGRNYKIRPGDDFEADMAKAAQNVQNELFSAFSDAVGGMGLSGKLGLNMDLTSGAGIEKAAQGVTAWKEMQGVLDGLLSPVAALTSQTNAANTQMNTWIDSLRALGWQEHKLAEIEARRAEYASSVTFQLRTQFDMEMTLREAQLKGTGELVSAQQAMWADMQSIITNFGAGSEQAKRWEAYQREAIPKMAQDLAKNQYQSQIDSLKQEARQQVQVFRQVAEALQDLRTGLRTDARVSPFDATQRTAEAGADFSATLQKALTGDATAAQKLSGLSTSYLELLKAGASTSAEYEGAFFGVLGQLEAVEKLFGTKLDGVDPGLLEQEKANKTLAEILAEITKLETTMKNAVSSNTGSLTDYLAGLLNGSIRTRATGGYTSPGLTLVGEEGPELVNFARPGMVYTAAQTRALRASTPAPHTNDDSAMTREIATLRRDTLLALDRIERALRRLSGTVDLWDADGLPKERTSAALEARP